MKNTTDALQTANVYAVIYLSLIHNSEPTRLLIISNAKYTMKK